MIDVRRLEILQAVARHGSFNRAATELRITASAVSQAVAALERAAGTDVVRRSTRGVELTDAGRVLAAAGDAIEAELAHAKNLIARLAAPPALTVATFTSGGQRLLPPALTRFAAEHPEVELTVIESEPSDSLPAVRSGAADLALAYHFDGPPPVLPDDRSGLTWQPLMHDPMWIVMPSAHRLAAKDSVTFGELAQERWIHGCLDVDELMGHYAASAGFEPRVACRGTDYVFAQALVRAGVGIAMIPQIALLADPSALAMVPLDQPCPSRFVGVVTGRPNPLADLLVRTLKETVAGLPAPAQGAVSR